MTALLKFDLTESDDKMAHTRCIRAEDMAAVLWEFLHNGRRRVEAVVENRMERGVEVSPHEAVHLAFDHFRSLLEEYALEIDSLYT
jgi:molybdopterin-guanine dinucleotide biosynthesis protein A